MSLEDTIRALVPGITADHLARTVAEVREATRRVVTAESEQPTPQVGDVWEHRDGGDRVRVCDVWADGTVWHDGAHGLQRFRLTGWRLVERDGRPWPPAPEQETARKSELVPAEAGATCDVCHAPAETCDLADSEAPHRCAEHVGPKPAREAPVGVEPATDAQIARWEELAARGKWVLASSETLALVARVRGEQAWRLAETESATTSALSEAAMGEDLRTAERERDEAVARAEKAEREVARMRPVVDAAGAYRDFFTKPYSGTREMLLNPLIRAVDAYRAAEKEAGRV